MLLVLALAVRVLVPAGYMPGQSDGRIVIGICNGQGGASTMVWTIPGKEHEESKEAPGAAMPCAFAGLGLPALPAVDPIQLALALLVAFALALRPVAPLPLSAPPHLRPPLRGPPATC